MKKNITFLLLFNSFFGFSQTTQQLEEINTYINNNKCDEAEKVLLEFDYVNSTNKALPLILKDLAGCVADPEKSANPKKAIEIAQKALELNQKQENNQPNEIQAKILQSIGVYFVLQNKREEAENYFVKSLEIIDKLENYPIFFQFVALELYYLIVEPTNTYAIKYFEKLYKIYRNDESLFSKDLNYARFLYKYYRLLIKTGRSTIRAELKDEMLQIVKTSVGIEHSEYNNLLIEFGTDDLGIDAQLGINRLKEGLYFLQKENKDSTHIAKAYTGISIYYDHTKKDFIEAEKNILQAIKYFNSTENINSNYWIIIYNQYGSLLEGKRDFIKAEMYKRKALDISEQQFGKESIAYLGGLQSLASFYQSQENKKLQSESLLLEGIEICKKIRNIPMGLILSSELSRLYRGNKELIKAINLSKEKVILSKEYYGDGSKEYIKSYNDILGDYFKIRDSTEYEKYFLIKSELINKHFAKDGLLKFELMLDDYDLNFLKWGKNSDDKRFNFFLQEWYSQIIKICVRFSPSQLEELILPQLYEKIGILSRYHYGLSSSKFKYNLEYMEKSLFDFELIFRNLIPKTVVIAKNKISEISKLDKDFSKKMNEYHNFQEKIFNSTSKENYNSFYQIENYIALERDLFNRLNLDKWVVEQSKISWAKISQKILLNEIALEFTTLQTDSIGIVSVFVLNKDSFPLFINLCTQQQIDSLWQVSKQSDVNKTINQFYNNPELYELIWKPLEQHLAGVSKIYFAPAGGLHKIAFQALTGSDGEKLSKKYDLIQLTSTRELMDKELYTVNSTASIALFGGINYDADSTQLSQNKANFTNNDISYTINKRDSKKEKFSKLQFTDNEVKGISSLFNSKANQLFIGNAATEEQFKLLGSYTKPSPTIIHLATHGFYFDEINVDKRSLEEQIVGGIEKKSNRFKESSNPLLRSGLVMAGANHVWQGKPPYKGLEDGILTAQEIANLNLSNTKLVVLSACESGLGDIKNNNEGVYGLQRAFKMAGVEYLLVSLWSVDDFTTQKMMRLFYTNLKTGMSIEESYKSMVENIKNQYPDEPFKWASFVLIK